MSVSCNFVVSVTFFLIDINHTELCIKRINILVVLRSVLEINILKPHYPNNILKIGLLNQ